MSYNGRKQAERIYKSARLNRFTGRMQATDETESGAVAAIYCQDNTRRPAHSDGSEGAFYVSHREAKVAQVVVTVPKSRGRKGRIQVEAIMGGMEIDADNQMREWIGYEPAAKRYGRRRVDECQKTMAARVANSA